MREFIALAVRTLTVLALVVGLPLLALPPFRARVSDWMEDASKLQRFNLPLADLGFSNRHVRDAHTSEDDGICWQAAPVVESHNDTGRVDLAGKSAEPNPLSSQKPNLPSLGQPPARASLPSDTSKPQLQEIRQHLIKLGAQYMRLDEVAGQPAEYHFSCLMPMGYRAVYSRKFTSSDSDPIRAMERVLNEVERWQEARSSL